MRTEAEQLIEKYGIGNLGALTYRERLMVTSTIDQFKIAYWVYRRFKYYAWSTHLEYQFPRYYLYDMYWHEYVMWLAKKKFLDFVPPSDLQDKKKKFIIDGEEVSGSVDLYSEFMEEKAQCRVGGGKYKSNWGGVEVEITRIGKEFVQPKRRWRRYGRKKDANDRFERNKGTKEVEGSAAERSDETV